MKHADTPERPSYTPAIIAAGAGIVLYVASKIGELVVILLMWGAYAALAYAGLHVLAAWLGVPLLALIRETVRWAREFSCRGELMRRSGIILSTRRSTS